MHPPIHCNILVNKLPAVMESTRNFATIDVVFLLIYFILKSKRMNPFKNCSVIFLKYYTASEIPPPLLPPSSLTQEVVYCECIPSSFFNLDRINAPFCMTEYSLMLLYLPESTEAGNSYLLLEKEALFIF